MATPDPLDFYEVPLDARSNVDSTEPNPDADDYAPEA